MPQKLRKVLEKKKLGTNVTEVTRPDEFGQFGCRHPQHLTFSSEYLQLQPTLSLLKCVFISSRR